MLEKDHHHSTMNSMSKDFHAKYTQLQKQFLQIGWIAQGSAYPRHFTIHVKGKPKTCGPYYCLTWKEAAKTRTKSLSTDQYKLYSKAIANNKKLENILSKMRQLSTKFINQTTKGVPSRIRLKLT